MSRAILRYLLFYLFVSAILVCGLSRRIPRTSCPSCSQDCPEALTVRVPWHPHRKSNLQSRALSDFPVNPHQNSVRSRLTQRGISQDIERDDNILPNQNSISFESYKSFPQKERGDSFFKNLFNKLPKSLDRQEIFSQNISKNGYPPVFPSRQVFDRLENLFSKEPRNEHLESAAKKRNFQNYKQDVEDTHSKLQVVYRADADTAPSWKDSKESSSDIILPKRSFPNSENTFRFRRGDILNKKRDAIKRSSSPYVFSLKDLNIWKSPKINEFFDNWNIAKDSSQSSNLELLKQTKNNPFKAYSAKEQDMIPIDNDGQIDYDSYMLSPDFNTPELKKAGESIDNWNFAPSKNTQESAAIKRLQDAEFNRMYPLIGKDIRHFENREDEDSDYFADAEYINQEYFDDEMEKDAVKTEQDNYNPYALSQNILSLENEELDFDYLDFMRENLQGVQKIGQQNIYSEENLFQDNENKDIILEDKAHTNARAPVINAYNAYILPRYLNILNDAKNPAEFSQIPAEAKNNVHASSIEARNERFLEDDATIQDNARIQDLILSKDIFDLDEYNSPAIKTQNIRDNSQNQALSAFDPDLLDDVEGPPMEPTESTLTEFSTSQQ